MRFIVKKQREELPLKELVDLVRARCGTTSTTANLETGAIATSTGVPPDATTAAPCVDCMFCDEDPSFWPCDDPPPAEDSACFAGAIGCDPGLAAPVCEYPRRAAEVASPRAHWRRRRDGLIIDAGQR